MPSGHDDSSQRAAVLLFVRLALALALPLCLIGAGIWWYLGTAIQDEAIDAQAGTNAGLVQATLGQALVAVDGEVVVFGWEDINTRIDDVLRPGLGVSNLRIVTADGKVAFSTVPEESGLLLELRPADLLALDGTASGSPRSSGADGPIGYEVPLWLEPQGEFDMPVALAQLEVEGDPMVALTADARSSLLYPALGALVLTWLVLVLLSWWQVRDVRIEATANRRMAMSDSLTGLANRMRFHERLDEAIAAASRSTGSQRVGLLMLDLDGFKAINDTGGHAAGDRLLRRVSAKLEEATRLNESACRLGGDEFAIVVPQLTDRSELVGMADRLHKELDLTVDFNNGRSLRVSASIGLAVFPEDADNSDDLVSHADVGMYTVKANRRAKLRKSGVTLTR